MNLALLLPAGLAALAALLLPLLLHLARRSEHRPTDFAALRWLTARARPRRRLRFDEWPLLVLRLLLVAALALLLARPVLHDAADATPWVVAAPGVDAVALRAVGDEGDTQRRWLAPGFPDVESPPPTDAVTVGSLLRELDATLPAGAPLTVLVPGVIDGADAQRPRLSREVEWRVVPGSGDHTTQAVPGTAAAPAPPKLVVRHTPDRADNVRYLRAATVAWHASARDVDDITATQAAPQRAAIDVGDPTRPISEDATALAWLVPGPLPDAVRAWIAAGGTVLLASDAELPALGQSDVRWRDEDGHVLVRGAALGRGQALRWTRPMTPAAMPALLEADFPTRLRTLFTLPPPAPARVAAEDYAPLAGAQAWPEVPRELTPWLALLIAALFLVERWLAASPRRRSAA